MSSSSRPGPAALTRGQLRGDEPVRRALWPPLAVGTRRQYTPLGRIWEMCGIVGKLHLRSTAGRVDPALLHRMRDELRHRGPDGAGSWIDTDGRVGLAHRRLAVVDLSAAADQPMHSADGSLVLTFNGEIYNHADLRRQLDAERPDRWRTDHSDTEVLLRAWAHWGPAALDRLNGMFAFALWDARTRALWLARDRMGIKPLYYRHTPDAVSFASELKALLCDPSVPRAIDEEAFSHHLALHQTPPDQTLIAGIRKVPAATWIRVDADGTEQRTRYWDPWDHVVPIPDEPAATRAERVREALGRSVALRRVADVPVGTFLSGGIDSSTVTALLARDATTPVRTFSVGYRDVATHDAERDYAARFAASLGARHAECVLDADGLLEVLDRAIWLAEEPSGHGTLNANLGVATVARRHGVIVALSGEGSDELFYGYPEWLDTLRTQQRADRFASPALLGMAYRAWTALGRGNGRRAERLRRLARGEPLFWGGAEGWPHAAKLALLAPRLRHRLADHTPWDALAPIWARFQAKAWDPAPAHWATHLALETRLPEMLLRRLDLATMGVGVEGRVPFLDHHLVELVLGMPAAAKRSPTVLKPLLKQAVRGLVPDEILVRPKEGMPLVPMQFLRAPHFWTIATEEIRRFVRESDLLDPASVQRTLDARSRRVWGLFQLARWWHRFIADRP